MAFGKIIGGVLGFISGGPLGALLGIVLGGLFEKMSDAVNTPETQGTFDGHSGYQSRAYTRQQVYEGQRNSFLFSISLGLNGKAPIFTSSSDCWNLAFATSMGSPLPGNKM